MLAGEIRKGVTFEFEGNVYRVVDFMHVKPGKGSAFVRTTLKNVMTGKNLERTFNPTEKLDEAQVTVEEMQFLYESGDNYVFMNTETYDQVEVPGSKLEAEKKFLKEGLEIQLDYYEGELLGVTLPEKIEFEITETEPAVKGNTTNNAMKDAKIETGYTVKVPMFINQGEKIIISTSDGKYSSRA